MISPFVGQIGGLVRGGIPQEFEGELFQVVEVDLESLKRKLDEAGAPWTAGRAIPTVPGLEAEAVEAGAKEDDDSQ